MRLCSGKFKRGMKLNQVGTGKAIAVHSPILFFAQDREIADEAFPGDDRQGERDYFSCPLVRPSRRRATTSNWICCVPSKMSRIFESRDHFSRSERSE